MEMPIAEKIPILKTLYDEITNNDELINNVLVN